MIAFGYLIAEMTSPLRNKRTFMGVEAHQKTPIEVAATAFIAGGVASHTLLIVDSFQVMQQNRNKKAPEYVADGKAALNAKLEILQEAFNFGVNVIEASSFMGTPAYHAIHRDIEKLVTGTGLEEELKRELMTTDLTFALHEIAATRYMQLEQGIEVKVGQKQEKGYDCVIGKVTGLDFAYLHPFFTFGTGEIVKTPYSPDSGTKNGGKRIMFGDGPEKVAETIKLGPLNAQIALTRLGFAAATLHGLCVTLSEKHLQPENCLNSVEALIEQVEVTKLRKRFGKYRYLG